jgi:hypothetical protein
MILTGESTHTATSLSAQAGPVVGLSPQATLDRLRHKRSQAYVDAMKKLDAGGHIANRQTIDDLLNALRNELPDINIEHFPTGIVARCYLGHPYEVHTLDRTRDIVEHYQKRQPMPDLLERARVIAQHPGYAFIEVYSDKLIAVTESGETSVIK